MNDDVDWEISFFLALLGILLMIVGVLLFHGFIICIGWSIFLIGWGYLEYLKNKQHLQNNIKNENNDDHKKKP